MNKIVTVSAALLFAVAGMALASGGADLRLDPAPVHRLDTESLQRGARNFVNFCLNCHSARFMRYERLKDIGLTEQQIEDNLMFGTVRIGSTMTVAMTPADARNWFGAVPPDLSVIARVRGVDWLYNYFLSFYRDDGSATGWNNLVFPNVAMPHALWQLSGPNRLVSTEFDNHESALAAAIAIKGLASVEPGSGGKWHVRIVAADPDAPGSMTPVQYRTFVADLVNFLDYVSEPSKNKRISLGIVVVLYLVVLFVLVYALKRLYWKDVH
ncbi:MAG: cytochrome c1 [Burkholderiales bacterium]|nr:cytochrome c1 [Burkholderiales bacterium]